jgi:hypothetical protein
MLKDFPVCPRCLGYIPSNTFAGEYPGAISRIDNKTEICSDCGTEEAIVALITLDQWPIVMYDHPACKSAHERWTTRLQMKEIDNEITS